jgi:L-cystine transport system ATP-binding protein
MIRLSALNKYFDQHHVLRDVNLKVEKGQVMAVLGPSGSGKSTLLRCVNFLEKPSSGRIEIGSLSVEVDKADNKAVMALRAATAMVFQQYNLFKNMTALQNVMVGLTAVKRMSASEAKEKSLGLLEKVGLGDRMDYYPSRLSGGQQQRVSIARALALNPEVMLFDEPTSSLDPELVGEVLAAIKQVAKEGNTMIIVTHELHFAREVADTVVFLDKGLIVEQGDARQVFHEPKEERTRRFLDRALRPFVYQI